MLSLLAVVAVVAVRPTVLAVVAVVGVVAVRRPCLGAAGGPQTWRRCCRWGRWLGPAGKQLTWSAVLMEVLIGEPTWSAVEVMMVMGEPTWSAVLVKVVIGEPTWSAVLVEVACSCWWTANVVASVVAARLWLRAAAGRCGPGGGRRLLVLEVVIGGRCLSLRWNTGGYLCLPQACGDRLRPVEHRAAREDNGS